MSRLDSKTVNLGGWVAVQQGVPVHMGHFVSVNGDRCVITLGMINSLAYQASGQTIVAPLAGLECLGLGRWALQEIGGQINEQS